MTASARCLAGLWRRAARSMSQQQKQTVVEQQVATALCQQAPAADETGIVEARGLVDRRPCSSTSTSSGHSSGHSGFHSRQAKGDSQFLSGPDIPRSTLSAGIMLPRPSHSQPSWLGPAAAAAAAPAPAASLPSLGTFSSRRHAAAAPRTYATTAAGGDSANGGGRGAGRGGRRGYKPPVPPPVGPRRNQEISAREVRVVFPPGEDKVPRIMPMQDALKEARQRKLDLVEVTAAADPPVCKIADYEKVLYEARKKVRANEKAAREAKKLSEPKEVRVGCHIAEHDLEVKMEKARQFVGEGYHLRLVVTFKGGRELQLGREMVSFLLDKLDGLVVVKNPKQLDKPQQVNQWAVLLAPAPQKPAKGD